MPFAHCCSSLHNLHQVFITIFKAGSLLHGSWCLCCFTHGFVQLHCITCSYAGGAVCLYCISIALLVVINGNYWDRGDHILLSPLLKYFSLSLSHLRFLQVQFLNFKNEELFVNQWEVEREINELCCSSDCYTQRSAERVLYVQFCSTTRHLVTHPYTQGKIWCSDLCLGTTINLWFFPPHIVCCYRSMMDIWYLFCFWWFGPFLSNI